MRQVDASEWMADPEVEVWLPDGRWSGIASDVSDRPEGATILRKVIVASGFAGPLFGFNPKRLTDDDFERLLQDYRLVCIRKAEAATGAGGPGDLAWVWPVSTVALLWLVLRRRGVRA